MKYLQMKHFRKILIFGSYCDLYQKERNIAKDKINIGREITVLCFNRK